MHFQQVFVIQFILRTTIAASRVLLTSLGGDRWHVLDDVHGQLVVSLRHLLLAVWLLIQEQLVMRPGRDRLTGRRRDLGEIVVWQGHERCASHLSDQLVRILNVGRKD